MNQIVFVYWKKMVPNYGYSVGMLQNINLFLLLLFQQQKTFCGFVTILFDMKMLLNPTKLLRFYGLFVY